MLAVTPTYSKDTKHMHISIGLLEKALKKSAADIESALYVYCKSF